MKIRTKTDSDIRTGMKPKRFEHVNEANEFSIMFRELPVISRFRNRTASTIKPRNKSPFGPTEWLFPGLMLKRLVDKLVGLLAHLGRKTVLTWRIDGSQSFFLSVQLVNRARRLDTLLCT